MALVSRLLNVFRIRSLGRDFEDEVRFHLEQRVQQNLRLGMTTADAEQDAYRRFGNVEHTKTGMLAARLISIHAAVFMVTLALTAAGAAGWMLMTRRSPPIYELTDGISAPIPLEMAKPEYTPLAKRAKVQGAVGFGACCRRAAGAPTSSSFVHLIRTLDSTAKQFARYVNGDFNPLPWTAARCLHGSIWRSDLRFAESSRTGSLVIVAALVVQCGWRRRPPAKPLRNQRGKNTRVKLLTGGLRAADENCQHPLANRTGLLVV